MFLGQESKYNGKFRSADSKNLQKPCFVHEKPSKIIDFSWFSLSELTQRSRHAYRGCILVEYQSSSDRNTLPLLG